MSDWNTNWIRNLQDVERRLVGENADLKAHIAYLEAEVKRRHATGVIYPSGRSECQCGRPVESMTVHVDDLLRWPR